MASPPASPLSSGWRTHRRSPDAGGAVCALASRSAARSCLPDAGGPLRVLLLHALRCARPASSDRRRSVRGLSPPFLSVRPATLRVLARILYHVPSAVAHQRRLMPPRGVHTYLKRSSDA